MLTRTRLIRVLVIVPLCFLFACKKNDGFGPSEGNIVLDTVTPLKTAAEFPIGVAISYTPMLNDGMYSVTVKRDFDAVTFDYHMKHGAIVKNDGTMDFSAADALVTAAGDLKVFGHTLGWHQNQNATYLKNYAGLILPSSEMLTNPGFENGLTNWSVFNTGDPAGTATVTAGSGATEVRTGSGSMKVVNPSAYPGNQWRVQVASPLFPTVVGSQYIISYWVKAATAGGSIRLSTQDQSFANAQYQGDQTIGTAWQQVTWNITANSAQTRFLFDLGQAANTYYIDDASFKGVLVPPTGAEIAAKVDTALGSFITAMVNRYKTKVKEWDVVNELFAEDGTIRNNANTPGGNDVFVWSHYLGRDYALKAFNYAKAADPTALLYINDYNLETNAVKLDSLIAFVAELKSKGAKVDGIGTQMHISSGANLFNGIDAMMQKLAATGLMIRISELDVKTGGTAAAPPTFEMLANQAIMYKYVVNSYMRYIPPAQRGGITVWGLTDNTSWLSNNGVEHPLLYDQNYKRKPAYSTFLQGLTGQ